MSDIYQENITGQVSSSASISGETKDTSPPFKIIFPFDSVAALPKEGKENALYIDKSVNPNIAYRWDADESAYIMVGGGGGNFSLDTTLTASGAAADAAAVGAALSKKSNSGHSHTADEIGADSSGTAANTVSTHNVNTSAHNDIRILISGLTSRLNALADSDDTTLDQLSEIVAYIQANRGLIESVTTAKVNTTDIIDNLETNVPNKPLSAAQGVAIKQMIDAFTVPEEIVIDTTDAEAATQGAKLLLDTSALPDPNSEFITAENVEGVVSNFVGDVLLWSSSDGWSSGSLTVPNLSSYRHIVFEFGDVFEMEGLNNGSTVRGGNSICTSGAVYSYGFYFDVSGDTLTRTYVKRALHKDGEANTVENYTGAVTAIYGRRIKAVN